MLEATQIVAQSQDLGLTGDKKTDAKKCIFHMMSQIVNWRKLHHTQDNGMMDGGGGMDRAVTGPPMGMHGTMMMPPMQDQMMMQEHMTEMPSIPEPYQADFRPSTAAAIAAVQQQQQGMMGNGHNAPMMGGQAMVGGADYRPTTAAAIAAVQQQNGMAGGMMAQNRLPMVGEMNQQAGALMMGGDYRPDTAAAIAAVQQQGSW
eukprot:TRINITY_DN55174_c0_g1_i1.p1 TRINITY_DN55174_c0_g1~~TRINITY_DN55174_c0_g1_i1.p1  ORF type:complete len:203 (-),score=58.82 TRINITY_DN55174_c0_g1_i1:245-853(-)